MLDPYHQFILCLWLIVWSMWGVCGSISLYPYAPSWQWKLSIIAMAGPCVWAIALWRGILCARHAILHHYGVEHCGCHHD